MREQKLVEKEKVRAHDWIADLKLWFELEKQNFQDKFSQLEENLKKIPPSQNLLTPQVLLPMCRHRLTAWVKGRQKLTMEHILQLPRLPLRVHLQTDSLREASDSSSTATGTSSSGGIVTDATGSDTLVKSITELIMAQVQVVTKVASVQSLPSHH